MTEEKFFIFKINYKNRKYSTEPGYYQENGFGIRIEDVLAVVETENPEFLSFKNVTLAPYDKNLLDLNLLSRRDVEYINDYHRRVNFFQNYNLFLMK